MHSAVYFPFAHPGISLLKRALLTWDRIEVIGAADQDISCRHLEGEFREAWEFVCKPRTLSEEERLAAHRHLRGLGAAAIAQDLRFDDEVYEAVGGFGFPIADAFGVDEETAGLLVDLDLARMKSGGVVRLAPRTLSVLYAVYADVMAGVTKQQITDDLDTYSAYCGLLVDDHDNDAPLLSTDGDQLVSVALETVNLQDISLRKLIDFRMREDVKEPDLRRLRENFASDLAKFIRGVADHEELTPLDWEEMQSAYRQSVSDDIRDLSRELRCETSQFLLSKDLLAPILMGAATLLTLSQGSLPTAAGIGAGATVLSVASLISQGRKTINKKTEILRDHALSYIYELSDHRGLLKESGF